MNSLAEALGMSLTGNANIPAPYRERGQMAYKTGLRIVDMVKDDLTPSMIMTRESFENAIIVKSFQFLFQLLQPSSNFVAFTAGQNLVATNAPICTCILHTLMEIHVSALLILVFKSSLLFLVVLF